MRTASGAVAAAAVLAAAGCSSGDAEESTVGAGGDVVLATTTSTQNSGLLDEILPMFEENSDCTVKTVAVGSGQAMEMGERGDADVLLVHSPEAEERFMADGHGSSREPVMHNDFVLLGPPDDPSGLAEADDAAAALAEVAEDEALFASRGDDSGTHAKELSLWEEAGIEPGGSWYVETGQGMGETLTVASQKQAYTLSDRGTFLATSGLESEIAFEGTEDLNNDYHVVVVDHEGTNTGCAEEFSGWIRGEPVQRAIAGFGVDEHSEPLFFPDALD
ncbi:substrate-binding domain-containing protein [Allosalinactinospora lopnorensis]|uniref:substrate-binding domain-containing protein n=1 Tax=Allosalinactinospora lopnorensis TaxID=1352348 RepID=UPI000623C1DB|nr:substrate-binding domain-containing protein [Allosalinactinospora lopnorensis]